MYVNDTIDNIVNIICTYHACLSFFLNNPRTHIDTNYVHFVLFS